MQKRQLVVSAGWLGSWTFVCTAPAACLLTIAMAAHTRADDPLWVRAIVAAASVSVLAMVWTQGMLLRATFRYAAQLRHEVQRLRCEEVSGNDNTSNGE